MDAEPIPHEEEETEDTCGCSECLQCRIYAMLHKIVKEAEEEAKKAAE